MRLRAHDLLSPALLFLATCTSDGGGGVHDHHARLTSSNLGRPGAPGTGAFRQGATPCASDQQSCTPSNMSGRIFSGGAMLGELGPGAFNLTMLAANDELINDPSSGLGGETLFDLQLSELYTGKIAAPDEGSMPSPPIITRIELSYDYLDVSFTLTGTPIDDSYTVRTVFVTEATAEDVTGTMWRGDKLVKSAGQPEFRWCNQSDCSPHRSEVSEGLLVAQDLVDYQHPGPGHGNPNYVPYAVELKDTVTTNYEEISSGEYLWEIDFDISGAILFAAMPESFSRVNDMVAAFALSYSPTQGATDGPNDEMIRASLYIDPLPTQAGNDGGQNDETDDSEAQNPEASDTETDTGP